MPLFGNKTNSKSQLSFQEGSTGSLGRSPHQSPTTSPVHTSNPQSQAQSQSQSQSQSSQFPTGPAAYNTPARDQNEQQSYQSLNEVHPAHRIGRSQSHRLSSGPNVYSQPLVNLTGPG